MKSIKGFIPVFASLFVSISAVMALIAMVQPQVFSLVPGVVVPDSLQNQTIAHVAPATGQDSLHAAKMSQGPALPHVDTVRISQHIPDVNDTVRHGTVVDTVKTAVSNLAGQGIKIPVASQAKQDTLRDTELKKMVQIFEAMDAENAAKILVNMDDFAIRQVLTSMKKRQSAKILSALGPQQAARILNGRIDS